MQAKRTEWFERGRLGMFIHWGLYSVAGRGEWLRSNKRVSNEDYQKYFDAFDPVDYDPRAWARSAKAAGMKYVVLTAKHHDGFCLFDSKLTDYKATNTKAGRDLVKDYVEAVRAEGLKVGLYYSLVDWHHPDYPKYDDLWHPMRGNERFKDDQYDFNRYLDYMHGQVEELCTNYGKLDIMWYDFSYGRMSGETWRAAELIRMVRGLQPGIVIDNRLDERDYIMEAVDCEWGGDFTSPEQCLPPRGMRDANGQPVPWELCLTMNNSWGFVPLDHFYKSPELLIRKLVECVSKGGNMILNVGPDPMGRFPKASQDRLDAIGDWLRRNGESVYGCGEADIEKPDWGRYTQRGDVLYAHLFEQPIGPIALTGIDSDRIESVTMLCDGTLVRAAEGALIAKHYPGLCFLTLGEDPNHTYPLPDAADTVLKIKLRR